MLFEKISLNFLTSFLIVDWSTRLFYSMVKVLVSPRPWEASLGELKYTHHRNILVQS